MLACLVAGCNGGAREDTTTRKDGLVVRTVTGTDGKVCSKNVTNAAYAGPVISFEVSYEDAAAVLTIPPTSSHLGGGSWNTAGARFDFQWDEESNSLLVSIEGSDGAEGKEKVLLGKGKVETRSGLSILVRDANDVSMPKVQTASKRSPPSPSAVPLCLCDERGCSGGKSCCVKSSICCACCNQGCSNCGCS